MADTLNISRSHLILAICLPVAVLIGFVLAEPLESPSLVLMILVLGVLMVPVLMKWHHPLLICSWNMMLNPIFLPGRPELWMVLAEVSLLFILLNRAVTYNGHLNYSPSITKALFFLTIVVVVTAALSGGVGFGMLGSAQFGGRKYFYLLTAVVGYFALSGRRIPRERAGLYVGVFFLFGLTAAVGDLVVLAGPKFYFFLDYFPTETAAYQVESEGTVGISIVRYSGFAFGVTGIYSRICCRATVFAGSWTGGGPGGCSMLLGSLCVGMLGGFRFDRDRFWDDWDNPLLVGGLAPHVVSGGGDGGHRHLRGLGAPQCPESAVVGAADLEFSAHRRGPGRATERPGQRGLAVGFVANGAAGRAKVPD